VTTPSLQNPLRRLIEYNQLDWLYLVQIKGYVFHCRKYRSVQKAEY
jgi:hypothetical protein